MPNVAASLIPLIICSATVPAAGACDPPRRPRWEDSRPEPPGPPWEAFFDETVGLRDNAWFLEIMGTMGRRGASAVKMAKGNGAAGDVCVWARRRGDDPSSVAPTLSLRRQGGGATARPEDIKIRVRQGGEAVEKTLARRLSELGLFHGDADGGVEVFRQIAILPVPGAAATAPRPRPDHAILYPAGAASQGTRDAGAAPGALVRPPAAPQGTRDVGAAPDALIRAPGAPGAPRGARDAGAAPGVASRAPDAPRGPKGAAPPSLAFTFSANMDGAAAYVITDGPSGGGEAVVAGDWHMMLFADAGGERAPFTARVAAEAVGQPTMHQRSPDADAQCFCIIQVPLVPGAAPGDFGAAPDAGPDATWPAMATVKDRPPKAPRALPADLYRPNAREQENTFVLPKAPPRTVDMSRVHEPAVVRGAGFERLSVGLGAPEGPYSPGGGFRGNRDAARPVRVTYVYLVAPGGSLREADARKLAEMIEGLDGGD